MAEEAREPADDDAPGGTGEDEQDEATPPHPPWDPQSIRISTKAFALRQVVDDLREGTIDLAPDFQRPSVWTPQKQSLLIESVLLGIPLPIFYFNADRDRRLQVMDGVQRLTAFRRFTDDELALQGLEYLPQLNGKTWKGLEASHRRAFHHTQIIVHVIDATTPADVKTNIFKRINTGGTPLSPQEIRHAMTQVRSREMLARMTRTEAFRRVVPEKDQGESRMFERELALRFVAFTVDPTLDAYDKASTFDAFLLSAARQLDQPDVVPDARVKTLELAFETSMVAAWEIFGPYAFRITLPETTRRNRLNRALFDSWSVALSEHPLVALRARREAIACAAREAFARDAAYLESVRQGTNVKDRILKRFEVARAILRGA